MVVFGPCLGATSIAQQLVVGDVGVLEPLVFVQPTFVLIGLAALTAKTVRHM